MTMEEEIQHKRQEIGRLTHLANVLHHERQLVEAVDCYTKAYNLARAVNNDKTERTCAFNLGAAYIEFDDPEKGLEFLHKAKPPGDQKDNRSNGDLYLNIGLGYEKLGDADKALKNFWEAYNEYSKYEREKDELQIHCLEKCFQIHQKRQDYEEAAECCQLMADVYGEADIIKRGEKLCEKTSLLRRVNNNPDAIVVTARECRDLLPCKGLRGQQCIDAAKILNDLGLILTQTLSYFDAIDCFLKANECMRADEFMPGNQDKNIQLKAVILQNLGAAFNFTGEHYDVSIQYHEKAAKMYANSNNRNGQGQCFINLAFAYSQLRAWKKANIAYHHALQAAEDTGDNHMKWQAYEGLGAVQFNQRDLDESVNSFIEALRCVGENNMAYERIKEKMLCAINDRGSHPFTSPPRIQVPLKYTIQPRENTVISREGSRQFMSTHGPVEEHNQLSATPRSHVVEQTIVPKEAVPLTAVPPLKSQVPVTERIRRGKILMRKKDSIGPHYPKVALGLGSMTYDTPRSSIKMQTLLQEESSEDESSSASGSSSETSSGGDEDEADQANRQEFSSPKVDEIFAKTSLQDEIQDDQPELSLYQRHLQEQEENEDTDSETSSSEDTSGDSDDEDSDGEDGDRQINKRLHIVPRSSPSTSTAQDTLRHAGTYLQPAPNEAVVPPTDSSKSSFRDDVQKPPRSDSPQQLPSSEEEDESKADDDNNINDDTNPYASLDTTTKVKQPVSGQGNERKRLRSENFFDSDPSSPHNDQNENKNEDFSGEGVEDQNEGPDFAQEGPSTENGDRDMDRTKFENLPRAQKEAYMAKYHREHEIQNQGAPPLPPRSEGKQSKTCTIM